MGLDLPLEQLGYWNSQPWVIHCKTYSLVPRAQTAAVFACEAGLMRHESRRYPILAMQKVGVEIQKLGRATSEQPLAQLELQAQGT